MSELKCRSIRLCGIGGELCEACATNKHIESLQGERKTMQLDVINAESRMHQAETLNIRQFEQIESLQGELDKTNTKLEKVLDRWAFRLRGMFAWRRRARKAEATIEHVRELLDTPDSMVSFITISKIRKALKENSDE